MKPVWILRHVAYEGPGYLADFLETRGIPWRVVPVDEGIPVPTDPEGASGLVLMGGPMSVHDPLPWIGAETALIQQAWERALPVLGHCLGGQLIARALGAEVGPCDGPEIGWFTVDRVPGPAADRWLEGVPERFEPFHWHGEGFALPDGAEPLLTNGHTLCQGFAYGTSLALQCHVEATPALVRDWAGRIAGDPEAVGARVQGKAAMTADLEDRWQGLRPVADALYGQWVQDLQG